MQVVGLPISKCKFRSQIVSAGGTLKLRFIRRQFVQIISFYSETFMQANSPQQNVHPVDKAAASEVNISLHIHQRQIIINLLAGGTTTLSQSFYAEVCCRRAFRHQFFITNIVPIQ